MYIWLTGVAAILLLQISECQTCKTDSYIMPTTDGIREMEDATTGVNFSFVARSFQKFELSWSAPSCDSWSQEDNITFIFEKTPKRTKIEQLIEESFTNCSSLKKFKWESMETVQLKISFRNATSRKYCYKLYSDDDTLNIVLPAPKIEKNNISDPTKLSFIGQGFHSSSAKCRLKYKEGQSLDNDWLEGTCPAVEPQTSPHKCYITNVKRGTSYSVKIACQLRNMPLSNWSDPKVYFTPMAAPTGKVSAVNIKDTGDSGYIRSVNVSWQTIPEDQQNGEILFFSISVQDTTCGAPQKTYNTSMLSYIIHDLYYSCDYRVYITASNPVGESPPRVMNLDMLNRKPSPAREFAVISISSESIQLSWREPEQPYGEINYTLSVQRKDSGTLEQSMEIVPTASRETGEVESYNVTGLAPYTTYQLKLVAKNYYSENDGIILEKTTDESVPTKGPVDLTLGHMAAQVTVRWGAVPQDQRNGIIVNYTLFWWQRGNSATCKSEPPLSASNITVTGDSHTIEGLEEKTSYCVTVTASTSVGQGPPAEVKNITTQRGAVTVRHITVINTTSDSISLEWNLPKDVNSTQLQLIQIYHNDAKAPLKLYNGLTSHTLTNLEPYTNYSISVQACWSKFQLDSCGDNETVHVRTISTVPSEPTDLITSYLAYDHVNLTWHPPKKPNGPISHYVVTYCNDGSKMQQEEKTKSLSMTLNIPCSTTGTGRTFMFQVAAVVDGLIGPAAKHNTTMCENVHRVSDFIIALIGIPGLLVSALLSMACCWAVAPKRNLEIKHAKAIYQPNMVNSCAKVPEKEMFDTLKCQTDMKLESNSETYVAMEPNRFAALRTSTSNQSYMQMSRDTGYVSDLT